MKIITVLGTRPEIIKLSPLIPLLDKKFKNIVVHTGQHYNWEMDKVFFKELDLREPDYNLHVGSGNSAYQIGTIILRLEKIIKKEKPNAVIVYGDTNTTLAGALVGSKMNLKVIHIEAGCRSRNRKTPEEINRILTDHCSDMLFSIDEESYRNLIDEGIDKKRIFLSGNTITEVLSRNKKLSKKSKILRDLGLKEREYAVVTMHRAENTSKENIKCIIKALNEISKESDIVFPIHPRTKKVICSNKIQVSKKIKITEPLGYLDFIKLLSNALFVMTDSGGIQAETVELNIPCLVLRNETEYNEYIRLGKIILAGTDTRNIIKASKKLSISHEKIRKIKYKPKKNACKKIIEAIESMSTY
ncbi:MAG: UDP-N-acetylglucosamine 2-epimerase (non-hydrolyzing) [Candidatus Altiarchaeota archaeon]|nr:UDP-N-acetylglucosamine 2-epimerase (non-hydrolyzing) [Candidatus Altiarchaeota archaeon]